MTFSYLTAVQEKLKDCVQSLTSAERMLIEPMNAVRQIPNTSDLKFMPIDHVSNMRTACLIECGLLNLCITHAGLT